MNFIASHTYTWGEQSLCR